MKQPLYSLSQEYLAAYETLCSLEDMPEEAIKDTLQGLEGQIEHKAVNIAAIIKNFESDSEAIKTLEANLSIRRKALEKRTERLKDYLLNNLNAVGIKKVFSTQLEIRIQKNPAKVIIDSDKDLHANYIKVKEIREPDKLKIKEAIESGEEIKGVRLEQSDRLVIK
jgi:hypothetical protein